MPHLYKTASYHLLRALVKPLAKLTRNEMESTIAQAFASHSARDKEFVAAVGAAIAKFGGGIKNDIDTNGEKWLIEKTGPFGFQTIFDVGANVGHWSELAYKNHAEANIHAFEIVPDTFSALTQNTEDLTDRLTRNNIGLMDRAGDITIYTGDNSELSSIHSHKDQGDIGAAIKCPVKVGADYAKDQKVDCIDFMKVDTEGAEAKVLKGFESYFDQKKVRLVLFEYNRGALMSRFLLADFYAFFTSRGYKVGKLTPEGVLFREYDFSHEDFNGPNYVACLEGEEELIWAISAA